MAEIDEPVLTHAQIKANIAAAKRRSDEAGIARDDQQRRKREIKQHKMRVSPELLNGRSGRDHKWTILCRLDRRRAVESLSKHLSRPGAKVSVALLMEQAIDLLIAHYNAPDEGDPCSTE